MILVATDFSNAGARAAEFGARLAKVKGSGVCLLNVFEPPAGSLPELALDPRLEEELRGRAAEQLVRAAGILRESGVEVTERFESGGDPAQVIASIAEEVAAELVVLGRHGRRMVPRLLLGSVAESALVRINQPVLIVPEGDQAPGPTGNRPWHVAVGVDTSDSSAAAIDWVRDLRKVIPCDVTFIHLYWPVSEYSRFGLVGPRDIFQPDPTAIGLLERSLAPVIGTLPGTGETRLRTLPNWGSPGERLVEEAARAGADLLVLGTHHRHGLSRLWHGSTVTPALHAATMPVVCVSRADRAPLARPIPRLRKILAATDLSELGNHAIAHAYSLARGEGGIVHLLHVHERSLPSPAFAYAPTNEGMLVPAEENEIRAKLLAQVPSGAAEAKISTEITIVDGGRAAEVICQTAERLDADAVVLGSRGRTGVARMVFGSVAAEVLHRARRPVVVVPPNRQ